MASISEAARELSPAFLAPASTLIQALLTAAVPVCLIFHVLDLQRSFVSSAAVAASSREKMLLTLNGDNVSVFEALAEASRDNVEEGVVYASSVQLDRGGPYISRFAERFHACTGGILKNGASISRRLAPTTRKHRFSLTAPLLRRLQLPGAT